MSARDTKDDGQGKAVANAAKRPQHHASGHHNQLVNELNSKVHDVHDHVSWEQAATSDSSQDHRPPMNRIIAFWIIFPFIMIFLFCISYLIMQLIQHFTGTWPELVSNIATGVGGVVLLGVSIAIFAHGVTRHGPNNGDFSKELIDALDRIAHGDFSVRLANKDKDPFFEVTQRVNSMAEELGTLEAQRQEFVSNVSHEIQSPLTSISGFAELLENEQLSESERHHYLQIIHDESLRLSRLADNLLKLTTLDEATLNHHLFNLREQLQSTVLMLEPQWRAKNIELVLEAESMLISADEELLKQVWVNLIYNAIKFTPEGGRITVRLDNEGQQALVSISDTGIGIAPADMPHIFERFYKADKSRDRALGGNGLGLSLVRRIIELHGGDVTVESRLEKGTTFTVRI